MSLNAHIKTLASDDRVLVRDLVMQVPAGKVLTLMGPSGCGKSSVLAALAGTLDAVSGHTEPLRFDGEVELDGRRIEGLPCHRRQIGLLFQDPLLFAHMSVRENLLFAVPTGPAADRDARVREALQTAELADMGNRDPSTLSGGQRARIALMRALLAQPRALLLDEPFSRLDTALRAQFRDFVFSHVRDRRIPAVLVTHDREDIADRDFVVELNHAG